MYKVVLRRVLILIPQLIAISLFVFILAEFMPGDALSGMLDPNLPLETLNQMREDMGLNLPWYTSYYNWIMGIFQGDFGSSTTHFLPVTAVVGERMPNTLFLGAYAMVLTYLISIPLGILAGRFSAGILDKSISIYAFIALALPTIVFGIVMIRMFSTIGLGWFPLSGTVDAMVLSSGTNFEIFVSRLHHVTLPAISIALLSTVGIIFMLRANIIDKKDSEYVILAKSKGVPTSVIFNKHILRNSLVPIMANIGLVIVGTLMGSVFIEMIFNFPGIGRLFLDSINLRDFPVVNFLIMMFALLTAIGVLLSDIVLAIVDPRIRIR